jgi:hemolysin III
LTAKEHDIGETIANSVTHGLGLLASLIGLPIVILSAVRHNDPLQVAGASIYGLSLVILYAASTVYHSFPASSANRLLRVIDHSAIYILIAGSYTPFALGPLRGRFGWTILAIVWAMAVAGIFLKVKKGFGKTWLTVTPYIVMGWISVVMLRPLAISIGPSGIWWLFAGGLCYTGGIVFYATDQRVRYGHAVWHLFVLAGSTCHYFAVLWHSAPPA